MPTRDLYRLVYYSRTDFAGPEAELAVTIRQILESSRRNNLTAGVSGALMFNAGCFAQVLEGPGDAVERTFERIGRDMRHTDVMVLQFAPVSERGFPSWSMAFIGRSTRDGEIYGGLAGESGFNPARLSGEHLFEVLRSRLLEEEGSLALA